MATLAILPETRARAEHRNLGHWMDRALKQSDKLRGGPDKDTVHDLRVALRRCRSIAAVMAEVDAAPPWHQLRATSRKLFRRLGALRDTHVLLDWVARLASGDADPLCASLQQDLEKRERSLRASAARAAAKFDRKKWERLGKKLAKRARVVSPGGLAAQCLAFERLTEARDLHARALRSSKPRPWHELRIGLKRLRYTAENLLPEFYAAGRDNLKRLQDLLGDVHDLDVLSATMKKIAPSDSFASHDAWQEKIAQQRAERVQTYRQLTLGNTSLWNEWSYRLPRGDRLAAAAAARLRSTARASAADPQRTTQISHIAVALFDAHRRARVSPAFGDRSLRRILRAALRLHRSAARHNGRSRQKAAFRFLRDLPVPPTWTVEEWEILAAAVRYHRGAEPKVKRGAFAKLSEEQQAGVRVLAGTLRLARALRKSGVQTGAGMRVEKSESTLTLSVPGLLNLAGTAERLAAGKHLLETYLGRPLVLKPAVTIAAVIAPAALPNEPVAVFAEAAD